MTSLEDKLLRRNTKMLDATRRFKVGNVFTRIFSQDYHVGFHDPRAVDCILEVCDYFSERYEEDFKTFDITGDFYDCYANSRFDKNPKRALRAQQELDEAADILKVIDRALPDFVDRIYQGGNHEKRFIKEKWRNQQLYSIRDYSIEHLLDVQGANFRYMPYGKRLKFREFQAWHGSIARGQSAYSGRGELDKSGITGITGHSHRGGIHYKRKDSGITFHAENFCMCKYAASEEYIDGTADWQQGFGYVLEDKKTGYPWYVPVQINDGVAIVDGIVFGR